MTNITPTRRHAGRVRLEIKFNNAGTNDPCSLCGSRTDPIVGPEMFLAGTWGLVCIFCSEEIDPALLARLRLLQDRFLEVQRFGDQLKNSELVAMIGMAPEES